jgi:hypothetical protein
MKKNLLALVLIFCSSAAWPKDLSLADWQHASVKVSSFPCSTGRPRFSGSGLLVSYRGETWVVSSEHVVLNGKSPAICHEVTFSSISGSADLRVSDYKNGLALLKLKTPTPHARDSAISMESLASDERQLSEGSLVAIGFPALSNAVQTLTGGSLIAARSERALIPGLKSSIEAANLPVEYGMSGGVLVSSVGGRGALFAGLLSHQVLKREAGHSTLSSDLALANESRNDLTIAISAADVKSWLTAQFENSPEPVWQRLVHEQINGREVIQYGPLLFSIRQENAKDIWTIGGADGSGVGGADGSGIGGADGSGIGGADDLALIGNNGSIGLAPETLQTIDVALDPAAGATIRAMTLADSRLNTWKTWLLSGKKVKLVFLKSAGDKRLIRIRSLSQFFTAWMRDADQPMAVRSQAGSRSSDDVERLLQLARQVTVLAQTGIDQFPDAQKKAWFATIRDLSVSVESGLVTSQDLTSLLSADKKDWQQFYEENFDSAVALESAVQNLTQQMKKMGL